ncbi:MAG: type III-B CRISPR module-associated protein Cmr5 [Firmicutes bacterium]|nr:type III-B CRISPR module-associated protein Cmr5 [Bacillota bacterium]
MNKLRDIERERARLGFYIVKEIIKQDNETAKKFKTHIKNIPMYIYANGLIATLAFILKKSNQSNSNKLNLEEKSYNYISKILMDYFEILCMDEFKDYSQLYFDGTFTADELRIISDAMDNNGSNKVEPQKYQTAIDNLSRRV